MLTATNEQLEEERRMTRVETRLDTLDHKVDKVDVNVEGIHTKLDAWSQLFVPRNEIDAKFDTVNRRINVLEQANQTKRINAPFWIAAIIAGAQFVKDIWPHK